jgi:hypothetical protein
MKRNNFFGKHATSLLTQARLKLTKSTSGIIIDLTMPTTRPDFLCSRSAYHPDCLLECSTIQNLVFEDVPGQFDRNKAHPNMQFYGVYPQGRRNSRLVWCRCQRSRSFAPCRLRHTQTDDGRIEAHQLKSSAELGLVTRPPAQHSSS